MTTRIEQKFLELKKEGRPALIPYMMAGYPDYHASSDLFQALPAAGADLIELGIAFSDPTADGPSIRSAATSVIQAGHNLQKTIQMVREFRQKDNKTPIIAMGYYNPIYVYGSKSFLEDAKDAGIDGLLVVDLPPEMDEEFCLPAREKGLDFIRLVSPTTQKHRLNQILKNMSGFIYYVTITGITGQDLPDLQGISMAIHRIKEQTSLPVAAGFGVKTKDDILKINGIADAIVVGTALIDKINSCLDHQGDDKQTFVAEICEFVSELRSALSPGLVS